MSNDYPWVKSGRVFAVYAEYGKADRGAFFRDDCPGEKWSVRPGADASSYYIMGLRDKEFSSPEETLLYLNALAPEGFALDLHMCDREAGKFIRLWRDMSGGRGAR